MKIECYPFAETILTFEEKNIQILTYLLFSYELFRKYDHVFVDVNIHIKQIKFVDGLNLYFEKSDSFRICCIIDVFPF